MPEKADLPTIAAIRTALEGEVSAEQLSVWRTDPRKGVQNLAASYERRLCKIRREEERLEFLHRHERRLRAKGYVLVAGVDEAGRGPLAGPVSVGAAILPPDLKLKHLNDSKKLTRGKRRGLFDLIQRSAVAHEVALVDHRTIDEKGIHAVVFEAMRSALRALSTEPDFALIDGFHLPESPVPCEGLIDGDAQSASIAAASILAKETRDRLMEELDAVYPEYGFAKHKGYGTAEHLEALRKHGPCPIHRMSFKIVSDLGGRFSELKKNLESADNLKALERLGESIRARRSELSNWAIEELRAVYAKRKEAIERGD